MGKNKRTRIDDDSFSSSISTSKLEAMIEKLVPIITDKIMASVQSVLQPLVQDLRDRVKLLEEKLNRDIHNGTSYEEERERKRAIVITGLPEQGQKASERHENDITAVRDIIDELDVDATATNVFRMGLKTHSSRQADNGNLVLRSNPRLLKVILQTSGQQREVVRNAWKMKDSARFRGIFLRPSLTKEQRDSEYNLRMELRRRRENGERVRLEGWPGEENRKITTFNDENYHGKFFNVPHSGNAEN